MPLVIQDELMTTDELAQYLKVNRRTIYRLLDAGELPFAIKFTGNWRFRLSDVERWLESQKMQEQNKNSCKIQS